MTTTTTATLTTTASPAPHVNGAEITLKPGARTDFLDHVKYPSKSLNFLSRKALFCGSKELEHHVPAPSAPTGPVSLNIMVVGAGLGGLATALALAIRGHRVTVLEQAPVLAEVGAGIQIPPNSSRILHDLGLQRLLSETAVEPESMTFRRWENGETVAKTKLVPEFQQRFHAPYYVIHRADFHQALHTRAVELGIALKLNHRVVSFDPDTPSVTLADGEVITADLIVAADGIKSIARTTVGDGRSDGPHVTGFAAYRATVDVDEMKADCDTAWLLEKPNLNLWIGQDRHVMTYTIQAGKRFNMVLSHVDHTDPNTWSQRPVIEDMKNEFRGWDPRLLKVISMIDKTAKWQLMTGLPQTKWVSSSGKLLILGDAAHAMLPYMSQGAAMAVEDGAALAEALSHARSPAAVPEALRVFELVRYERTSQMQKASLTNGMLWHFADGPEQVARDAASRAEVLGLPFTESSNQWSDPTTQAWAYGYDAVGEIRARFELDLLCGKD